MRRLLTLVWLLVLSGPLKAHPDSHTLSLQLDNAPLPEALRILAEACQKNLIISPEVKGTVTLSLHKTPAEEILESLIRANDLVILQQAGIPFVLPREKLLQQKQREAITQAALQAAEPIGSRTFALQYATASDMGEWLSNKKNGLLSERGSVLIDGRTNQIIVRDIATRLQPVADLIRKIDIPVQQVLIETRLASVDRHFERELGLEFSTLKNPRREGRHSGEGEPHEDTHYSLAIAHLADNSLLDIELTALENTGHGELISRPSLFTANRKPAFIESGEEIPYQEISRSGATGIAFRKAVLSLQVTPEILPGHRVLLHLKINQDKPAPRMVLGVPAITTRQISSSILARDGQTIVLGGIYESSEGESAAGIPFLSQLPLAGRLFQKQLVSHNKRELLVFVTPRIVASP